MLTRAKIFLHIEKNATRSILALGSFLLLLLSPSVSHAQSLTYIKFLNGSGSTASACTSGSAGLYYDSSAGAFKMCVNGGTPYAVLTSNSSIGNADTLDGLHSYQLFNNTGSNHTTYQTFGALPNFGFNFMQGQNAADAPSAQPANQYYVISMGLGNDYPYTSYANQIAFPRIGVGGGNNYMYVRQRESSSWGSWGKIYAGYADSAGSATDSTKVAKSGDTMTGDLSMSSNIVFNNVTTGRRDVRGTMGDNDFWSIGGNPTASNSGVLEIATGDDTTEPIVVRQYSGAPWTGSLSRTAYLLDGSGNTSFPGSVTATAFSGSFSGTLAAGNVSSGTFGSNTGGGAYTFPSNVTLSNGIVKESNYAVADAATNNLLVNGDFEMGSTYGWSGLDSVVSGGYSGYYAAQRTGGNTVLSDDYIPVNPVSDVLELDGYFKKSVAGSTPGIIYFGYIAYDANKNAITSSPCGTYCYFAAAGYTVPVDGAWHKLTSTTSGEGTSYPNFPVGTKFVRVLVLINYAASGDAVTLMDHVTLRRINNGPLFVGNNFGGTNMNDQSQVSKIYTTSGNNLIFETAGNVGIGTTGPGYKLDVIGNMASRSGDNSYTYYGPNASWGGQLYVGATGSKVGSSVAQVIATSGNLHLDAGTSNDIYLNWYSSGRPIHLNGPVDTQSYNLTIGGTGYQRGGYTICDSSNNCGYAAGSNYVAKAGDTMSGSLTMGSNSNVAMSTTGYLYSTAATGNWFRPYDGSNMHIRAGTGGIYLDNDSAIHFRSTAGNENMRINVNSSIEDWYRHYFYGGAYFGNGNQTNIETNGNIYAPNYYYASNNAYGFLGSNVYADTINTGSAGDPLEINYYRSGPTRICASASCGSTSAWFGTDGNVGIGTTGPNGKLDVSTGSDGIVLGQLYGDNTAAIQTYIDSQWSARSTYASGCCNMLYIQKDAGDLTLGNSRGVTINGSVSVPIMYDQNNTGYYVDPNGTSRMNQLYYVDQAYIVDVRPQYMYDWNDSAYYMDFNNTSRLNVLNLAGNLNMYNSTLNAGDVIYLGSQNSIATSAFRGINFHTTGDMSYYIGKPAGSWTQPLHIAFYTGIKLGANTGYGGTRFYASSDMATELMSIGNGDSHVRVANNLYVGGQVTVGSGSGKIDVGTVDPPYTIGGEKYATYTSGMTGVNEETYGVISLKNGKAELHLLDAEKGSDLWLFAKTANLKREGLARVAVLLTQSFKGQVWYEKKGESIIISSTEKTGEISYRLTAPRFDHDTYGNRRPASDTNEGFNLDTLLH